MTQSNTAAASDGLNSTALLYNWARTNAGTTGNEIEVERNASSMALLDVERDCCLQLVASYRRFQDIILPRYQALHRLRQTFLPPRKVRQENLNIEFVFWGSIKFAALHRPSWGSEFQKTMPTRRKGRIERKRGAPSWMMYPRNLYSPRKERIRPRKEMSII